MYVLWNAMCSILPYFMPEQSAKDAIFYMYYLLPSSDIGSYLFSMQLTLSTIYMNVNQRYSLLLLYIDTGYILHVYRYFKSRVGLLY